MFTAPADWYLASVLGLDHTFHRAPRDLLAVFGRGLDAWSPGVARRDPAAVGQLIRMLAVRGVATGVAGTTACLSGVEHLVSHMLDMYHGAHDRPIGLHGAQVGRRLGGRRGGLGAPVRRVRPGRRSTCDALFPDPATRRDAVLAAFADLDPSGARRRGVLARLRGQADAAGAPAAPTVEAALRRLGPAPRRAWTSCWSTRARSAPAWWPRAPPPGSPTSTRPSTTPPRAGPSPLPPHAQPVHRRRPARPARPVDRGRPGRRARGGRATPSELGGGDPMTRDLVHRRRLLDHRGQGRGLGPRRAARSPRAAPPSSPARRSRAGASRTPRTGGRPRAPRSGGRRRPSTRAGSPRSSITHQRETFACVTEDGRPLRPAMLWLDTPGRREVAEFGTERVHRVTGKPPNPTPAWYKLLWLRRHEPETLRRGRAGRRRAGLPRAPADRGTGARRWASADPLGVLDMRDLRLRRRAARRRRAATARSCRSCTSPARCSARSPADVADELGLPAGLPVVAGRRRRPVGRAGHRRRRARVGLPQPGHRHHLRHLQRELLDRRRSSGCWPAGCRAPTSSRPSSAAAPTTSAGSWRSSAVSTRGRSGWACPPSRSWRPPPRSCRRAPTACSPCPTGPAR